MSLARELRKQIHGRIPETQVHIVAGIHGAAFEVGKLLRVVSVNHIVESVVALGPALQSQGEGVAQVVRVEDDGRGYFEAHVVYRLRLVELVA